MTATRVPDEPGRWPPPPRWSPGPAAFRAHLKRPRPIYAATTAYGRFEPDFTWETTDNADEPGAAAGL